MGHISKTLALFPREAFDITLVRHTPKAKFLSFGGLKLPKKPQLSQIVVLSYLLEAIQAHGAHRELDYACYSVEVVN